MVGVRALGAFAPSHDVLSSAELLAGARRRSTRKPSSLVSSMRGFMPSRIEATPSSVISRAICSSRMRSFIFPATGKIEEVGGTDAVDGGHEGYGDAASDFVDLVEVLHDLNQSEDRADDADGGGKASGRLEYLGNLLFVLGLVIEFEFHDLAELFGLGAVDRQH